MELKRQNARFLFFLCAFFAPLLVPLKRFDHFFKIQLFLFVCFLWKQFLVMSIVLDGFISCQSFRGSSLYYYPLCTPFLLLFFLESIFCHFLAVVGARGLLVWYLEHYIPL